MSRKNSADDREEVVVDRVIGLIEAGHLAEAQESLDSLVEEGVFRLDLSLLQGQIYADQGRANDAVEVFAEAVRQRPESQGASLGLFHALWDAARKEDAFLEMKRFLASHQSWEYRRLRRDLEEEGYLVPS